MVPLSKNDGNAYAILALVRRALKRAGADDQTLQQFYEEATQGDYDHLLSTILKWVDVT